MDADILNTIEEIRGYTFVAMIAIVVWVTIKSIQLIYPFLYRFSDNIHNFVLDLNYKSLKKEELKGL